MHCLFPDTVNQAYSNRTKQPPIRTIEVIAKGLNIPPERTEGG